MKCEQFQPMNSLLPAAGDRVLDEEKGGKMPRTHCGLSTWATVLVKHQVAVWRQSALMGYSVQRERKTTNILMFFRHSAGHMCPLFHCVVFTVPTEHWVKSGINIHFTLHTHGSAPAAQCGAPKHLLIKVALSVKPVRTNQQGRRKSEEPQAIHARDPLRLTSSHAAEKRWPSTLTFQRILWGSTTQGRRVSLTNKVFWAKGKLNSAWKAKARTSTVSHAPPLPRRAVLSIAFPQLPIKMSPFPS